MLGNMSRMEMGPVRIDRLHEKSLRGLGMSFSGNGKREVSILGRRKGEIDLSGLEGEKNEELIRLLESYGLSGEVAEELAEEMLSSWEKEKEGETV